VASGVAVGLPAGQTGNSEVGHLTIGAGRVISQDLTRISTAILNGEFNQNVVFNKVLATAAQQHKTLHILGLLSNGGVHSHEEHFHALLRLATTKGVSNIVIHAFLDGRDTPPKSAQSALITLEKLCQSLNTSAQIQAHIGSISGRYYAMDRDQRWERTQTVYELITEGKALRTAPSAIEALNLAYAAGETDEFVKPTLLHFAQPIRDEDIVIFMNFRADRARQLSAALHDPHFSSFKRTISPKLSAFITLTEYDENLNALVAFPSPSPKNTLGEYLQNQNLRQLRIAETEKYAHVTFFFNGGKESPFIGEDRILIPSPKVATYDLCPEMSAPALTKQLIKAIEAQTYPIIICNYANADMVGHTGNFNATVTAIEALDACLGEVLQALNAVGAEAIITADHGNAEMMFDESTQQTHTAHTTAHVPFIYIGRPATITTATGTLADIAPTLIALLGRHPPIEMTGKSLVHF
jgi:2,3-bisphosphoglycerate-independent phosphoglycerate mutase